MFADGWFGDAKLLALGKIPRPKTKNRPMADFRFGRSGETRTRGLMVPNHARYQLRYASIYVERETGIEPATFSLGSYCSTIEPFPHNHRLFPWLLIRYRTSTVITIFCPIYAAQSQIVLLISDLYCSTIFIRFFFPIAWCIISRLIYFVKLFLVYFEILKVMPFRYSVNRVLSSVMPFVYVLQTSAYRLL